MVFRTLHSLVLLTTVSLVAAQDQAVFSYCGGSDCLISASESIVTWGAAATTFTDAAEYSSFQASISASATDSDSDEVVVTINAPLPTKVIQTADSGFTTITCCDDRIVRGFFLFEPSSCGPVHTGIPIDSIPSGYDGYNSAYVTVLPSGGTLNDTLVLGENQCTTAAPAPGAAPPRTKTYYGFLVVPTTAKSAHETNSLEVPTLVNGPVFTGAPAVTEEETPAPAASTGSGEESAGQAPATTAGSNAPSPPPPAGTTSGAIEMPSPAESSASRKGTEWTALLSTAWILVFVHFLIAL